MDGLVQEAGEMQERATMALIQIRSELQKTGRAAKLQLLVEADGSKDRVQVLLQLDNYYDVMATSVQVWCPTSDQVYLRCTALAFLTESPLQSLQLCLIARALNYGLHVFSAREYCSEVCWTLQCLSGALKAVKEQLQRARAGFDALVAYYGENPAAIPNDGDFWRDITAFVAAFSAAQQDALKFEQVGELPVCDLPSCLTSFAAAPEVLQGPLHGQPAGECSHSLSVLMYCVMQRSCTHV